MKRAFLVLVLVLALPLILGACDAGPEPAPVEDAAADPDTAAVDPDTAAADPDTATPAPATAGTAVRVWFSRGEAPAPVERRAAGDPLEGALEALVAGPTAEERAAGLSSWFSDSTRGVIRSVEESDGRLVVDFSRLPELIPNASTSAGSTQLLASLDSTVFQFDRVDAVEYRLDGSCDAFWEWLQRGCAIVRRGR